LLAADRKVVKKVWKMEMAQNVAGGIIYALGGPMPSSRTCDPDIRLKGQVPLQRPIPSVLRGAPSATRHNMVGSHGFDFVEFYGRGPLPV
jgi:hypothetical protein